MSERVKLTAERWDMFDRLNNSYVRIDPPTGGILADQRLGPVQSVAYNLGETLVTVVPSTTLNLQPFNLLEIPIVNDAGDDDTLVLGFCTMWLASEGAP